MEWERTVLTAIVDDDPEIRHTVRVVLEDEGYAVVEAADGVEALDILRTALTSLVVLLDLRMPRLDGTGVLQMVAEDGRLLEQHAFVVMTANAPPLPEDLAALLARLSVPVLRKPFDIDALVQHVQEAAQRLGSRLTQASRDSAPSSAG